MKNRLQIKYYKPVFPYTREEAIEYIENLFATNNENARCSLPAEPIAVFYGDSLNDANVILAIGRGGNGTHIVNNVPYFLIDTAKMNEETAATAEVLDGVKKIAEQAQADIIMIKAEAERAASEILAIWKKIGSEKDGVTLDTVYGYINKHVENIMGGAVVEGLGNINAIANAIKRLRLRITAVENGVIEVKDRMNTIETRMSELDSDYDEFSAALNNALRAEQELRAQEHTAIRSEFATADVTTLNTAKAYTDQREGEINKKIENADNTVRSEFAAADVTTLNTAKAHTDARELAITSAYQEYTNTAKEVAINTSKEYADKREIEITTAYKNYADVVVAASEERTDVKFKEAKVKSSNNSIVISPSTEDGTDIKVNIDGNTIVQDEQTGYLKVSSEKLLQYEGENSIKVSEVVNGNKTISLQIHTNDKVLSNEVDGLFTNLSLKWVKGEVEGAKDQIQLLGKDKEVISAIDVAEFLKDGMLEDVTLDSSDANNPKLVFVFNTSAEKQTIDVPVKELLYVYKAGNGLVLNDSVFDIKISDTSEEYLTVASDGLKLNGVKEIAENISTVDGKVANLNTVTATLNANLVGEIKTREEEDAKLGRRIDETKQLITDTKNDLISQYNAADVKVKDDLTSLINKNTESIEKLNGTLTVDGSVKDMIFKAAVGNLVTSITPESAAEQTLLKKINVNGVPYFYASNNDNDMRHGTRVLSEIIDELITSNETLIEENTTLKSLITALTETVTVLTSKVDELENRLENINLNIDVDDIKNQIMGDIVAEAKSAIINANVFKGANEEIGVTIVDGESVTIGFSDDAVFMADYNAISDEE